MPSGGKKSEFLKLGYKKKQRVNDARNKWDRKWTNNG